MTDSAARFESTCVVLATYNEAPNLVKLLPEILRILPGARIIVVDDNSPDGTPELLQKFASEHTDVMPLVRGGKGGYGSAMLAGMKQALDSGAEYIATLDADFSHDPAELPNLVGALENADVAIGSRYYHGVRVLNWHPSRLLLSLFANRYVKTILKLPAEDATSGFRAYRASAVQTFMSCQIRSVGYSFLVEILWCLHCRKMRIVEVPVVYTERREGQSKMSGRVIREAVLRPWVLRIGRRR